MRFAVQEMQVGSFLAFSPLLLCFVVERRASAALESRSAAEQLS
jgi:hypothetical protein